MKILSIVVPCYNSEDYMSRCIDSLLKGGDETEIIIVDDGSTDSTYEIAERYREANPAIVRVVHKENGGHGSAVNAGLDAAQGLYFKVVDSDDFVREEAYLKILEIIRDYAGSDHRLDMLISNYVYDKAGEKRHKVMQYRRFLPTGRIFTWKEAGHFTKGHYILMHSVIFRTKLLKQIGLRLPEKCFYVDNLYVFEPLPYVENIYYLDQVFYDYCIGREDQSVNQQVMISRIDQQIRVNRRMVDYYTDKSIRARLDRNRPLKNYMYNYLEIITTVSSILAINSGTKENLAKKAELWKYIREKDLLLFMKLRSGILGVSMNLPGRGGRAVTKEAYKIARKIFKFN